MHDRILVMASGLVRFANWLNLAASLAFSAALVLSFVIGDVFAARIATK